MEVKNITINGTVLECGDCVQNNPGVIIEDHEGNKIKLSLSKDEAKQFAVHLFESVSINFNAQVSFY